MFDLFIIFIFASTNSTPQEAEIKARNICENVYWDVRYSSNERVQETCEPVWSEVYNYEK